MHFCHEEAINLMALIHDLPHAFAAIRAWFHRRWTCTHPGYNGPHSGYAIGAVEFPQEHEVIRG